MLTMRFVARSIGAVLFAGLLLAGTVSARGLLKAGDMAPDVFGQPPFGEGVHLTDYRGRIVVVSFFASCCGPCRAEVPVLAGLQHAAYGVQAIPHMVIIGEDGGSQAAYGGTRYNATR
jgi:thiol-disulfide isomerase/thioredoxin